MADVNRLYLNGSEIPGSLCFTYAGSQELFLGKYYVWLALAAGFFIIVLLGNSFYAYNRGKPARLILLWGIWKRYRFLIQQLVSRDFKTKYKRSILGYLWSFLNPLLTMLVQYIVFSTIFRSDIKNFPVLLPVSKKDSIIIPLQKIFSIREPFSVFHVKHHRTQSRVCYNPNRKGVYLL